MATFEVRITDNIMVPMRDGVELAADLYRPAQAGAIVEEPLPVLLFRTPYNKIDFERAQNYGKYFGGHGYIVVMQDCRGCFRSGGEVNFLIPEAEDGYDTLEWIDEQPWSNGKVGSFGTSWSGWTQTAMAALGPENLTAMIPNMSGADAYSSSVRHNGALELRFLAWAFWHSAGNTQAALKTDPAVDAGLNAGPVRFSDWLTRLPIRRGQTQLKLVPAYEKWAFDIVTRADYDKDYWGHPSMAPKLFWDRFPDIPTLLVGGWYDSYTRATFESYCGLSACKSCVKVLVGPWTHGDTTTEESFSGDVEFGPDSTLDSFRGLNHRWFDAALKGNGTAITDQPPVRIFVMGGGDGHRTRAGRLFHGGRWRDEETWPLQRTAYTDFYLHGDGGLTKEPPSSETAGTTYSFDPAHPVPSIGGNVSSLNQLGPLPAGITDPGLATYASRAEDLMQAGGFDQVENSDSFGCRLPYLPLGSRPDVLVFETEPLAEDVEVTGPVSVTLWVATSAVDTDFTAKLIDVYPPNPSYPHGYALNLTDSIQRLRYRDERERGELVEPGEVVKVTFPLYPTSNLFVAGHRIRVDISSSNFPRFDVNPNTGEAIGCERRRVVADNTVFHDRQRPSKITLPVTPST